jgi:hypothetical protein
MFGEIAGVAGQVISGFMGSSAADKAAEQQERQYQQLRRDLGAAAGDVETFANEYVNFLENLDREFDPLAVDDAFNSLYEAVIQPMERDFDENVLPAIQSAYSGGIYGAEAQMSGAAAEAESRARRGQAETKAQLRFGEREQAIARNYAEYDRRAKLGQARFGAQTAGPLMRAEQAPQIYSAGTDSIAAALAAKQSTAGMVGNIGSTLMTGIQSYQQRQQNKKLLDILQNQ